MIVSLLVKRQSDSAVVSYSKTDVTQYGALQGMSINYLWCAGREKGIRSPNLAVSDQGFIV